MVMLILSCGFTSFCASLVLNNAIARYQTSANLERSNIRNSTTFYITLLQYAHFAPTYGKTLICFGRMDGQCSLLDPECTDQSFLNPLGAEFFRRNINIYLQYDFSRMNGHRQLKSFLVHSSCIPQKLTFSTQSKS